MIWNEFFLYFNCLIGAFQISTKIVIISSQFLRAYRVCDLQFIDNEIQNILNIFKDLGYSNNFLEKSYLKARKRYFVLFNPKKI